MNNFEEAIQRAPVRQEWLDTCSQVEYVLHVASEMSWQEWLGGFLAMIASAGLFIFF